MGSAFKCYQDSFALPFFRDLQMASVAADHLVDGFIKIVKRCLLTGMRDPDGLQCLLRVFRTEYIVLKLFSEKPVFV